MQQSLRQYLSLTKLTPLIAGLVLSACGGTGQDSGQQKPFSQQYQGLAIDGYVARSLVFLDFDNNGTRDPWEPYAFTDDSGYYGYNPITGTDYCADKVPALQKIYCLTSNRPISDTVIRVDGGYDVLTGEPFIGQLSRRLIVDENRAIVRSVVSPLTSLFTQVPSPVALQLILKNLGIQESDLDIDYLNTDGDQGINIELLNRALTIHKVVSVISDRVADIYTSIGDAVGTPNDLSAYVYKHLAEALNADDADLDRVLNNPDVLMQVIAATEADTRKIYENRDLPLPSNTAANSTALQDPERITQQVANLAAIIERVMNPSDGSIEPGNVIGRTRAIEAVVIKIINEVGRDNSIDNAVEFFGKEDNAHLISQIISSLSEDNADLSQLVQNDFTGDDFDEISDIIRATQLPEGTQAFANLTGHHLKVSDPDLGRGPNNLKDSEVDIYFLGDDADTEGEFVACVKYIDGAKTNGTLGEANTRGELVNGFWSLLGASKSNGASFSLLLTIDFLGSTYQAIIKPSGSENIDGYEFTKYRFDYGGEIRNWHSLDAISQITSIPLDNYDCEARLPSRVGI